MIAQLPTRVHRTLTLLAFSNSSFLLYLISSKNMLIHHYRKGSYPDKYFTLRSTYLQGRPPTSVNMHWRRFAVSDIPLDDQKEFEEWLRARWAEKDQLLDYFFETGRFPSELAGTIEAKNATEEQQVALSAGYVESYVRLHHWTELGQIFVVLVGLAVLCKVVGSWFH